jgi:hypothetical protein
MPFADYEQLTQPLALPYKGKVYTLPELSIQDTIRLNLVLDPEAETTMEVDELERLLLGAAGEQMVTDDVPQGMRERALRTAIAEFRYGRQVAEQIWNLKDGDLDPKGPSSSVKDSTPSTSTGEATGTPSPASTTGTRTSRRKQAPSETTP